MGDYAVLHHNDQFQAIMVPPIPKIGEIVQFTCAGTLTALYTFKFAGPPRDISRPDIEFRRPDDDGNSRKVYRCMITHQIEGQWHRPENVRQACQVSVALRTVEYAPDGKRVTGFVALVERDLDFETSENRFYIDVEVGSSQQRADGKVLIEFSYFASFLAARTS